MDAFHFSPALPQEFMVGDDGGDGDGDGPLQLLDLLLATDADCQAALTSSTPSAIAPSSIY